MDEGRGRSLAILDPLFERPVYYCVPKNKRTSGDLDIDNNERFSDPRRESPRKVSRNP